LRGVGIRRLLWAPLVRGSMLREWWKVRKFSAGVESISKRLGKFLEAPIEG
jgi:hypothetical protein